MATFDGHPGTPRGQGELCPKVGAMPTTRRLRKRKSPMSRELAAREAALRAAVVRQVLRRVHGNGDVQAAGADH